MKGVELLSKFRRITGDNASPQLWDDRDVYSFLNEAVDEATARKNLIFDETTDSVCKIDITADNPTVAIADEINIVSKAYLVDAGGTHHDLYDIDRLELDRKSPNWRSADASTPVHFILHESSLRLHPTPDEDFTLHLEVFRQQLDAEKLSRGQGNVAIGTAHHTHLIHWALYLAYSQRDVSKYDPQRAGLHYSQFEDYFGPRPDAGKQRAAWTNRPHRNKTW